MAKKTEVRVKRTEAWVGITSTGEIRNYGNFRINLRIYGRKYFQGDAPVTIIDHRDLADLEARLKAAEAECKRLTKIEEGLDGLVMCVDCERKWRRIKPKKRPRPAAG